MSRIVLIGLLLGLFAVTASAQDDARWYEVEVIIFSYEGTAPSDPRLYRDPGLPEASSALVLFETESDEEAEPIVPLLADASEQPLLGDEELYPVDRLTGHRIYNEELFMGLPAERQFAPLRPDQLRLGEHVKRLERSSQYRPLLHVGWLQPVLARDDALPVRLSAGPVSRDTSRDIFSLQLVEPMGATVLHQLDGAATLMLSRYIHLEFDLVYRERLFPQPVEGSGASGAARLYRLTERRRIRRPDELHYFDHPRFGAIAELRRWEFPAPPASEETVDESQLMELGTLPDVPVDAPADPGSDD